WFHGQTVDHQWIASIQSLYFFGLTYVGNRMPLIDDQMRSKMQTDMPKELVLLCMVPSCGGAERSLARAGFAYRRVGAVSLRSEGTTLWVRVLADAAA